MAGTAVRHWGMEETPERPRHVILVSEHLAVRAYSRQQALWFITNQLVPTEGGVRPREMVWYFEFFGDTPRDVVYPEMEVTNDPEVIAAWAMEGEMAARPAFAVSSQAG